MRLRYFSDPTPSPTLKHFQIHSSYRGSRLSLEVFYEKGVLINLAEQLGGFRENHSTQYVSLKMIET